MNYVGIFFHQIWPRIKWLFRYFRAGRVDRGLEGLIAGKDVLIVGTGTSIDIDLLAQEGFDTTVGLHRVHHLYKSLSWRPDLLLIGDEALMIDQGRDIINAQESKTLIATGSEFWIPAGVRSDKQFCFFHLKHGGDIVFDRSMFEAPPDPLIVGRSVICLALQICLRYPPKSITITGVDFDYSAGYVCDSITNAGINKPQPTIAKRQFLELQEVVRLVLGIEVVWTKKALARND